MTRTSFNRLKRFLTPTAGVALSISALPIALPVIDTPEGDPAAEVVEADEPEPDPLPEPWAPQGVPEDAWRAAFTAWDAASQEGHVSKPYLTVIDYSLPETEPRLWVVDMDQQQVLFHEYVAHAKNSGEAVPTDFSNTPESRKTSIGVFKTGETYNGSRGYSLKLDGLEPGVNDNARRRGIVIHGSDWVSAERAREVGKLGRSWGCPAVDKEVNASLIETIRGGSLVVSYYPDQEWLQSSRFVASADVDPEAVQ